MENQKRNEKDEIIQVDELGRVKISMVKRKKLNIKPGDEIEIYKSGTNIILKKVDKNNCKEISEEKCIIYNGKIEIDIKIKSVDYNGNKHIIRKIDELGIIVLPIKIRKELNIKDNDKLKIYLKDDMLILINGRKNKYGLTRFKRTLT